jgi:hypothetical protein
MSMTNRSFLIAARAALIALAASVTRYYLLAIIAALVGAGIIIHDFYADSQQSPVGGEIVRTGRHGSSVQWSRLYINSAAASQPGTVLNVSTLGIMGTNVGDQEIKLDDVYFLCGGDERKLHAQIGRGGARYKLRDIGPLPPGALFFVVSDPLGPTEVGLSRSEFLKSCATVSFAAKYTGTTEQIDFDFQTVESALPKP